MNLLYSILIGTPHYSGWYDKAMTSFLPTDRMLAIRSILIQDVPEEKLPMFACVICDLVRLSTYGSEIIALDPNNTYQPTTRPSSAKHANPDYCFYQLVKPAAAFRSLCAYLDQDIDSRLNKESWIELMGAGCLQMLREV